MAGFGGFGGASQPSGFGTASTSVGFGAAAPASTGKLT